MRARALLLLALGVPFPPAVAAPAPELPVTVESLGLSFSTPDGWRLLAESSPEELVLAPGKSKSTPLLRVRAFRGRLSAKDRLAEAARALEGEEKLVTFQGSETWTLDGKTFETAAALYKKGSQEWHVRFTLVDQPNKLQHGFWLFGRRQDLERQWKAVQASIRSSVSEASPGVGADGTGGGSTTPKEGASFVWKDIKSGLRVASWPAGFEPEEASLARLSTTGLVLEAAEAPAGTELRLSRRSVGGMVTAESTADTLNERLGATSGVRDVKRLKVRVAGESAVSMRWTQEVDGQDSLFEVWLWKRGSALFRLDAGGPSSWLGSRKRRDLVKDFVKGLSYP